MEPIDLARELAAIGSRAPGSDAERRAALLLRDRLAALGRTPGVETLWARPNVAAACAWAALLGIVGSVLSVTEPRAGLAVLAVTLLAFAPELSGLRLRPLRRLTRERATQNVIAPSPHDGAPEAVTLIVAAGCDAPARARGLARPALAAARGLWPSPRAWLGAALLALVVIAGLRALGTDGRALGAVQLLPTVALLAALLGLTEMALAPPAAGTEQAGAAAVAVALAAALDASPPRRLGVEVVIAGAAAGGGAGMERLVRERRRRIGADEVAVLAIGPCGAGAPAWRRSDGPLLRLRAHPELLEVCARVAGEDPALDAREVSGRGDSLALAPRRAGWPALGVESRPAGGERPEGPSPDADSLRRMLDFCLALVGALDDDLAGARATKAPAAARAG